MNKGRVQKTEKQQVSLWDSIEGLVPSLILLGVVWFLFSHFNPHLLLLDSTTSGGDTVAHNYLAGYMRDYLLPQHKLVGWSPRWWGGFPMFQFYFFFPYLVMAVLGYVIPLTIAFKIVSVSGIFLLPPSAYYMTKKLGFANPIPSLSAVFTLPFLFHEQQTVWGMNIPSTMAGEISVSISFAFMMFFLGRLFESVRRGRFSVWDCLLFSLVVFTHLTTALVAGLASSFFLLAGSRKKILERVTLLSKIYLLAFLLTAFWTVPLVSKLPYSVRFGEEWDIDHLSLYPNVVAVFAVFAVTGIYRALKRRDAGVSYILYATMSSIVLFFFGYHINLVNIRFWPFHYYFFFIISAYGLGILLKGRHLKILVPIICLAATAYWINTSVTYTDSWINGAYEGLESKAGWIYLNDMASYLNSTPGRAANDLTPKNNYVGSSRVFEAFPYLSEKSMIEGGIVQSGLSSLFTYYIQCESSTMCAGFPRIMAPTTFNFGDATEHLKLFNVRHFIAREDKVKKALGAHPGWRLARRFGPYEVHELLGDDGGYVFVPEYEPVAVAASDWKRMSLRWFEDVGNLGRPLVYVDDAREADKGTFSRVYEEDVVWSNLVESNVNDSFVREWLILGTFPNPRQDKLTKENTYNISLDWGLSVPYIDEEGVVPYQGMGGGDREWRKYYARKNGFVDLGYFFEPEIEESIAYAHSFIYSPVRRNASLSYGSDDGVRIYLNGELVHINHIHRGVVPDQDRFEVTLNKGWNRLLVKIENVVSGWGFYVRFKDKNGRDIRDLKYSINPDTQKKDMLLPKTKTPRNCNISEILKNEEILFRTDCTNTPHIIKVSYFPNWKIEGAEKVYLVSPAFMIVYPTRNSVRLYYGKTIPDHVGSALTYAGVLIALTLIFRGRWSR